ncbi:MAG: hypothetical protein DBX52_04455 [Clostridiales bacterium]|nr:MAG: hypothetical protein DBX52_04455 [Clostridiales bacterium]
MFQITLYVFTRLVSLYALIMLIYCLATWFIRDRNHKVFRFLAAIAEPPLWPIKKFLGRFYYFQNSPIDFSPLILFFLLRVLISLLSWLARYLP